MKKDKKNAQKAVLLFVLQAVLFLLLGSALGCGKKIPIRSRCRLRPNRFRKNAVKVTDRRNGVKQTFFVLFVLIAGD